jgi:hypothetical protein
VLRFRRPHEADEVSDETGESIPVVALTATAVVAGSVRLGGRQPARALEDLSPVVIDDAVVMRLDDGTVGDVPRLPLEGGRLIALGQTAPATWPRIEKGIVVDVGPYVILAKLERRLADLEAGRLMCRAAIVGFEAGEHWRTERLGATRIESGHARTVRTGTFEDFEVACTLRRVAAGD